MWVATIVILIVVPLAALWIVALVEEFYS